MTDPEPEPRVCPECDGEGVVTTPGHTVNPASGYLVADPQAAEDYPCGACGGTGLA